MVHYFFHHLCDVDVLKIMCSVVRGLMVAVMFRRVELRRSVFLLARTPQKREQVLFAV